MTGMYCIHILYIDESSQRIIECNGILTKWAFVFTAQKYALKVLIVVVVLLNN